MVNVEFAYLFTPKGYVSIDLCAKRNTFETDFPEISSTNFNYVQFASAYYKGNKGFQKKNEIYLSLSRHTTVLKDLPMDYNLNTNY